MKKYPLALLQVEKLVPLKYVADVISYYKNALLGFDLSMKIWHCCWIDLVMQRNDWTCVLCL